MNAVDLDIQAAAEDSAACKWRPQGEFALVHPTGWSIARYAVHDEWRYLLWQPVDLCAGANSSMFHGPFTDVREAMRLHRRLALHETE